MTRLIDFQQFVNSQLKYNECRLEKVQENSRVYANCKRVIGGFEHLAKFIEENPNLTSDAYQETPNFLDEPSLTLSPDDIKDLPEELIAQLSISESDRADFEIISMIEQLGGVASLDQIIIALYKKTNEIPERSKINAKIYRISQKGLLEPVEGKKAVYRIIKRKAI